MNLKEQYKRLFENRIGHANANNLITNDSLLNEAPSFKDYLSDKSKGRAVDEQSFDWKYFIEQVESLVDTLEEFEQEVVTAIELETDKTDDVYWKQTENQTSRYIMGAHKQLTGLLKKLETGSTRVGPGMYKIPEA